MHAPQSSPLRLRSRHSIHRRNGPVLQVVMSVVVHAGRQFKPRQHLLAPGKFQVVAQIPQDEIGRALCQLLHDLRGVGHLRGPNQQMTVLGHQHVADDPEAQLCPQFVEGADELELEPIRVENAGAAIDVRCQVMQMIQAIIMLLSWHGRSLTGTVWWRIHKKRCMRHPRGPTTFTMGRIHTRQCMRHPRPFNIGGRRVRRRHCHSEAPVLWGPKNPCSFFERPVRQMTGECALRTAEILRRPKERGSSG